MSNVLEDYTKHAVVERSEDDDHDDTSPRGFVWCSSFVLRLPAPSDS